MHKQIIAVAVVLMVPLAGALETNDATVGVQRYLLEAFGANIGTIDTAGEYVNHTYNASKLHNFEVTRHRLNIDIAVTSTIVLDSTGKWNFTFKQDGTEIGVCHFITPTVAPGGFLEGDLVVYPHNRLFCERLGSAALNNLDHNHTITMDVTVESGTPDTIDDIEVSIRVMREDEYLIPQDANEILDSLMTVGPLLFTTGFLIAAARSKAPILELLLLIGAVLSGMYSVIFAWDGVPGMRTLSALLTVYAAVNLTLLALEERNKLLEEYN